MLTKTDVFIQKAHAKHGDKYDYSRVDYINNHTKVIIICKEKGHGEFLQQPYSHLSERGCPQCKFEKIIKHNLSNTNEFIEKAKQTHGETYDYSKVDYIDSHTNVILICKKHGEFLQTPSSHLGKKGCAICGGTKALDSVIFKQKAKNIHGETYDYSKVEYSNNKTKIIIICKEHGEFLQKPNAHLSGNGCNKCSKNKKLDTKTFINKAKEIHGETYDYSKVEYINCSTKVTIICKEHGEFSQLPSGHLTGKGCGICGGRTKLDNKLFISKAKEVHGETYDYSKVEYVNSEIKVLIICKEHGEFTQLPSNHLSGTGCLECGYKTRSNKIRSNLDEFIMSSKKIHGEVYDYSKVDYINSHEKVIIICKEHGEFMQTPQCHLSGQVCKLCNYKRQSIIKRSNFDDFKNTAIRRHGERYDYSKVHYTNNLTKVTIICNDHGEFIQTPALHLSGGGCPLCKNKTEGKLKNILQSKFPSLIYQFKTAWCRNKNSLPFDFCIPEHNIIIELDGPQHFKQVFNWSTPEKQFENDKYKEKCANDNNYSMIRLIQDDVFFDKYDWYVELCNAIDTIITSDAIINIYLCKNNEYVNY